MKSIFKIHPLQNGSLFQRIFRQHPIDNSIIEVNNLLASFAISKIESQQLQEIADKYQVNLQQDYSLNLQEFFAVHYNYYAKTDYNAETLVDVHKLAELLQLSPVVVNDLKNKIGGSYFRDAAKKALSKRRLLESDKAALIQLTERLEIESEFTWNILKDEQKLVVHGYMQSLQAKNRCTPDEYREVERMLENFALEHQHGKDVKKNCRVLLSYWETENSPLQTFFAGNAAIQKSESCYYIAEGAKWFETRNGSYGTKHLELINQGKLYLTNKRLVFVGGLKTSIIPLDRIMKVVNGKQEITIVKDKGKDPVLQINGDQLLAIILDRVRKGQY